MFVAIQSIIQMYRYTYFYCVDGSIWHFKFPKVVQAHALGEVGVLGTVLFRAYSGTILPIFIQIGSYLTNKEQKISWHSFFWDTAYNYFLCVPISYRSFISSGLFVFFQSCYMNAHKVIESNAKVFAKGTMSIIDTCFQYAAYGESTHVLAYNSVAGWKWAEQRLVTGYCQCICKAVSSLKL